MTLMRFLLVCHSAIQWLELIRNAAVCFSIWSIKLNYITLILKHLHWLPPQCQNDFLILPQIILFLKSLV